MQSLTDSQRLELLWNEREILSLINRFDKAANQKDVTLFEALWTEDAVWEIGKPLPLKAHGRADIAKMLLKLYEPMDFFFRTTQTPLVEFGASHNSATSITETIELARMEDGTSYANVAQYRDEFRKEKNQWLFSARHYEYIWVETEVKLAGKSFTAGKI